MDRVTFDGTCGTCRGWARWIAARDPGGARFTLDPGGAGADSIVVETADGRRLVRSDAVVHILRVLGRRRSAAALALVPRFLRDLGYRAWARARRRDRCTVGDRPKADRGGP